MAPLTRAQSVPRARRDTRSAIIGFLSVATVVPLVWMLMDRDPPHMRTGEIVVADPRNCDLPEDAPHDAIRAGSCVEVKVHLKVGRDCPAAGAENVTRHLRDALGVTKPIGSLRSIYGRGGVAPVDSIAEIRNFLVLPSPMPAGPATYISSACFACNPLQHLFWPVCIDKPDIRFEVAK